MVEQRSVLKDVLMSSRVGSSPATATNITQLTTKKNTLMKTIKNWLKKQKEDFIEFTYMIGLRTSVQQLAVGAAFGLVVILIVCGLAEWLESQY